MTNHLTRVTAAIVLLCSIATQAAGQPPTDVRIFMRAKLDHAKKVLEGLSLEDFRAIAKNAQDMALLSQASTWQVFQTAEYVQHSTDFRRSANALKEAAKNENLDGATLAYVDLTMKCVKCHKYVRSIRTADARPSPDIQSLVLQRK